MDVGRLKLKCLWLMVIEMCFVEVMFVVVRIKRYECMVGRVVFNWGY